MTTEFTIINKGLILLGESSIADYVANDKSVTCGTLYPSFAKTMLTMYNWRFAAKKVLLVASTTPANAWPYSHALPSDFLKLRNVYNSNSLSAKPLTSGYERFGNVIMSNQSTLYADYTYDIDEDLWPDWFIEFVSIAFAAKAAIPITEDKDKAALYKTEAFGTPQDVGQGGMFKVCKGIDSTQQPVIPIRNSSLIAARFS